MRRSKTPQTSRFTKSRLAVLHWFRSLLLLALSVGVFPSQAQTPQDAPVVPQLEFKDFFRMPAGPRGLEMSDTLRESQGRMVALTGYMVQQEVPTNGEFMFTPRPVQMSEHADGDADDLPPATVLVKLSPEQRDWRVPHIRGLIRITGVLSVGREESRNGRVSWVQMLLAPEATRSMTAFEFAGYMHSLQHRH